MKGEGGRVGGLGKQEPLSLAVIMCACVCVYMCVYTWTCVSARFVSCPLRLSVGKQPSGVVMADQAWRWRPHAEGWGDWPNEWTGPPVQISTLTDPTGHIQHGAPA